MTDAAAARRDEAEIGRLTERLAAQLQQAGMPRMPARVYGAILLSPEGALTAAEIGERLTVSPAAVSKAVQYLSRVHMITRGYLPDSRRDLYQLGKGLWSEMFDYRLRWMRSFTDTLAESVKVVGGEETTAGARLAEIAEYSEFLQTELAGMLDRWESHRANRRDAKS